MPIYANLSIQSVVLRQFTANSPLFFIPLIASCASFNFSKIFFSNSFQSFLYASNFKSIRGENGYFYQLLNSAITTESRNTMNCSITDWGSVNDVFLVGCTYVTVSNSGIHSEGSRLRCYHCTFSSCHSDFGGGVYHTNGYFSSNGCVYKNCIAIKIGGAIYHVNGGLNLYRSSFIDTDADQYPAFYGYNVSSDDQIYSFIIEFCYFHSTLNKILWYVKLNNSTTEVSKFELRGSKFSYPKSDNQFYAANYTLIPDSHVVYEVETDNMWNVNSRVFTPSHYFSPTENFTISSIFSETQNFSISNIFASSPSFSLSEFFTFTDAFTGTNQFSQTSDFTTTEIFTQTQNFTSTADFTTSASFAPTPSFSSSSFFTQTSRFSASESFTPLQTLTSTISPIPTRSPKASATKSSMFTSSQIFTHSSEFSQSSTFSPGSGSDSSGGTSKSVKAKGIMILFIVLLCIILLIGLIANIILCMQQIQSGEIITTQRI